MKPHYWICAKCKTPSPQESETQQPPRTCHACCTFDGPWLTEDELAEEGA